MMNYCRITS